MLQSGIQSLTGTRMDNSFCSISLSHSHTLAFEYRTMALYVKTEKDDHNTILSRIPCMLHVILIDKMSSLVQRGVFTLDA